MGANEQAFGDHCFFVRLANDALLRHVMAFWSQNSHGKVPAIEELRVRYDALFARFGAAPEGMAFTRSELDDLLTLAHKGIAEIVELQQELTAEPPPRRAAPRG